ncbi:hypothetical protein BD408DRAFT_407377 [Parasitella parasitica]|nr:hypothetical protein BD408DRAFT_407377 [Parasitella parasitica]
MAVASLVVSKKDHFGTTSIEGIASDISTDTLIAKKSLTYTLPTIYSAITTTAEKHVTQTEDPGKYHITLFTPIATSSTTGTTTKTIDPNALIPAEYSVLVSRAPNEVTRSTKSWLPATTSTSTSFSNTPSSVPIKTYSGLDKGKLIGVIIGSIACGLIAFYMFYVICWGRQKALRKTRKEKQLRKLETKNSRTNTINLDYDSEDEKQCIYHDDNQIVSLPRSQPQYDPDRVYYPTSRCDPKEDFRAYYRRVLNSTSNANSLLENSNTFLNARANLQPFYGGFNPYYGPTLHQQSPALFYHKRNCPENNSPFYPPQQSFSLPMNGMGTLPNIVRNNHSNPEVCKKDSRSDSNNSGFVSSSNLDR